jgi:serine/threonine protein kinase/uncharacterized membrane-anchored protein YhcB (DUF1043 family)
MTFGVTSLGDRIKRTGFLFRRQLWIWPIIAVLILATIGFWVMRSIESTMQANLKSELTTVLHLQQTLAEKWFRRQESIAMTLANDYQLRSMIAKLVESATATSPVEEGAVAAGIKTNELASQIAKKLGPTLSIHDYSGFIVSDRNNRIQAATNTDLVGRVIDQYESFLSKVLAGETTVCPPFPSVTAIKDERGNVQTGVTTMFVSVPVRDDDFQVVAALSLRLRPEREFTQLMQTGQMGKTGEIYAFDRQGTMVSNSRFENDLILLGLIPDVEKTTSILNLQLRDPGGNMLEGFRPMVRRGDLPLLRNVASAVAGTDGMDLSGFRDYRGVPVVGAWRWLQKYSMGLAIVLEYEEAFQPLRILQRAFYILFALLFLSGIAIFAFTLVVSRLQREAREAAIEAKQLGQYRLEERLGEGAMGVVYRGHHAMLRRPAAIKLLHSHRVNEVSIARFEHEVQITCQLNNPHTVAIYDYGRTPEGIFYYAMEYLDGIDLQDLVDRYGPQSDGRVAKILDQLCSSLFEAHTLGLVHRDIKPANIMLNRRGAEPDFVKLLDFGLVRAIDDAKRNAQNEGMAGTPLYMSPESIQTPDLVDSRSDLYAVGAVGYFLLTGSPVFQAKSLGELCQQHIDAIPLTPSQRIGRPVDSDLEHAILMCLEKNRAKRPQTARELSEKLRKLCSADSWTLSEAEAWWSRHEREVKIFNQAKSGATNILSDPNLNPRGASDSRPVDSAAHPNSLPSASGSQPYEQTIYLKDPPAES